MEKYKNIDIKTFITEKHMKTSQQYKKEKKELKYIDIDANIIEEQEEPISQEDKQKIIDYQKTLQEIKNEFEKAYGVSISKSGINHRMKKLMETIDSYRKKVV